MGPTRLDSQIFACVCAGIKPNRDTVALHEIFLVTVCGLYFVPMFIRGDRTNSHPCWYRIYNCLSDNIEYAKLYVHLLRLQRGTCPWSSPRSSSWSSTSRPPRPSVSPSRRRCCSKRTR